MRPGALLLGVIGVTALVGLAGKRKRDPVPEDLLYRPPMTPRAQTPKPPAQSPLRYYPPNQTPKG